MRAEKVSNEYLYNVIERPLITEKTTKHGEYSKYCFKVSSRATKGEIKTAVETLFNVNVVKVNVQNRKPKQKTFRGKAGFVKGYKIAIVSLENGQVIDFTGNM